METTTTKLTNIDLAKHLQQDLGFSFARIPLGKFGTLDTNYWYGNMSLGVMSPGSGYNVVARKNNTFCIRLSTSNADEDARCKTLREAGGLEFGAGRCERWYLFAGILQKTGLVKEGDFAYCVTGYQTLLSGRVSGYDVQFLGDSCDLQYIPDDIEGRLASAYTVSV